MQGPMRLIFPWHRAVGGTCQPDILVMWHALRGSDYELDVDVEKVREAEAVFKDCMSDYFLPPEATAVEPLIHGVQCRGEH